MTDDFYYNVEFYKAGKFDLISFKDKVTGEPFAYHLKQIQALELLNDFTTSYIGFGGGARGGKSILIATDAILCAYAYPECQNMIGRKNLTTLWETTWKTVIRTLNNFGFIDRQDYIYNGIRHELTFENKSVLMAKNLELKPSDVEATEYGSLEILRGYIDQSEHVPIKIIEKVGERAGSHFTTSEYGLKGKVFEAFNPSTSHTKRRYWTPYKTKTEKETRKFVRSLPADNPGREAKEWVLQKEKDYNDGTMSKKEYQKQIKGNFDYDDNPDRLCEYDNIIALFSNNHIQKTVNKYITADIARLGSDYARIGVWEDMELIEVVSFPVSKTTDIQNTINALRSKHGIPAHQCIADEDGVGGGVVDNCNIKGFVNNATPIKEDTGAKGGSPQYKNLQTQCLYKLANEVNLNTIYISAELTQSEKDDIIEEVEQIQSFKTDDDGKLRCKPKKMIIESIGRSPDWRDMILMRIWFLLTPKIVVY